VRFGPFQKLLWLQLKRDTRSAVSSTFGIAMGIGALMFFVALGLGVSRVVREKIFPSDAAVVEVVPSPVAAGLFGGHLDAAAFKRLEQLPGVRHAHRKMNVRIPAVSFYDGDFFGRRLRMGFEVLAVGVDAEFLGDELPQGSFVDRGPGRPIPVVAASRLVEIYNKSFAPSRGLPQLSKQMLMGFTFPIEWNRSFVVSAKSGQVTASQAEVVGVSDRGVLAGVLVPFDVAIRLNLGAQVDAEHLSGVVLVATSPAEVPSLVAAVKDMGFHIDDEERRISENIGAAVAITTWALALLSILICVLASFNIGHALSASVRVREREFGLMRAVGARRADVFALVFAEALALGVVGGLVGLGFAGTAAFGVDALAVGWLPEFPFKPDTFFLWPAWLPLLGVAVAMASSALGAGVPAFRASAVDPARVLAGEGL
jgi:putative ABC transport system permease protein